MATREERNEFSNIILQLAENLNTDHIDAFVSYCEKINLEVEVGASLINDVLRSYIHEDAQRLNYIAKSSRLPV